MKKILLVCIVLFCLKVPVSAAEFSAPTAPSYVEPILPNRIDSFGEGLWELVRNIIPEIQPSLTEAGRTCAVLISGSLMLSILYGMINRKSVTISVVGTIVLSTILLSPVYSLISLGMDTVWQISEYGKLLIPVMASAAAAQGGVQGSAALYAGTVFFDALLTNLIEKGLLPLIYIFICFSIALAALGEEILGKIHGFIKWLIIWCLKTILYIFTGYMGITGVVSGATDAATLKAAKLTISGVVPVVGGILSDASEAVLVGAGIMKNAAGIYGLLAILSITAVPFLRIGIQYLMLKLTGAVCAMYCEKPHSQLIENFSAAMGLLLAMTGAISLMFLISTVCLMKGMTS